MDLTESIAPKSDQLNAEDLLTGPRTYTIEKVNAGSAEQPVNVHLKELPGRPYRPSKSMRRLLVAAWGPEATAYTGRRLTLFRNPEIRFGGSEVGGIEISHLSDLPKALTVALQVTKGRRKPFTVQPLKEAPQPQQQPAQGAVSDKVRADTAKAIQDGTVDAYLSFLADNNAPAHVINYVTQTAKETN